MHKILLALSLLLFLSAPALAQSDDSCSPMTDSIDYVQLGDDIILVECPAMEGASCTCHAPPGEDGKCRVYACNADGVGEKAEVKPAPALEEKEKAAPPPKADAVKPVTKKKKAKTAPPAEKPAPAVEEKKTEVPPAPVVEDAPPVPEETQPAPAPAPAETGEKKIEYTR